MITVLKSILNKIINGLPNIFPLREFESNELTLKLKKEENGIKPKLIKFTSHLEDELLPEPCIEELSSRRASIESDTGCEMTESFLPFSKCRNVSVNSLLSYQSEKDQQEDLKLEEKYIDVDKDPVALPSNSEIDVDKDPVALPSNSEKVIFKEDKRKPFNHKTLAKALLFLGVVTFGFALVADMPILLVASTVFVLSSFIALCVERKPTTNIENIYTCAKPLSFGSEVEVYKLTCSENRITPPGI